MTPLQAFTNIYKWLFIGKLDSNTNYKIMAIHGGTDHILYDIQYTTNELCELLAQATILIAILVCVYYLIKTLFIAINQKK